MVVYKFSYLVGMSDSSTGDGITLEHGVVSEHHQPDHTHNAEQKQQQRDVEQLRTVIRERVDRVFTC